MLPQEQPQYILPQIRSRALIPKIFALLILAVIFYAGILVNVALLDLTGEEETIVKMSSSILVLLIVTIGFFLSFHKAHLTYKFYRDRIQFGKKSIPYIKISNTNQQQDFSDKIFKTYKINLDKKFLIRNISQETNISGYLQQMITYSQQNPTQTY